MQAGSAGRTQGPRAAVALLCGLLSAAGTGLAAPASDPQTGLPAGSELDADAIDNPREVFHSEALHGRKSYLANLGNLAFNSPELLGAAARRARLSCASCHVNGASNPRLFIPGLSSRPGTFDTTSALFNPRTDDGVLDALTIPSLRGARYLAPYGHDGRMQSLRDFVANVIVNEFAGPPPSAQLLDALVAYIQDIDFLPNPRLDPAGHLRAPSAAEQRGQALFEQPFPHDPGLSCAGCHAPAAAFVDHRQHDVGSGGLYKTPTLLNADFNAPYFHDGRFADYAQVIAHFDRVFGLGLSAAEQAELGAYLGAIGDGVRPAYHLTGTNVLADLDDFASVLDIALAQHDGEAVAFTVRAVAGQLQDLAERYPEPAGAAPGAQQLRLARAALAALRETLQRIGSYAAAGRFEAAAGEYLGYRKLTRAAVPLALQSAEVFSLFDPERHAAAQAVRGAPGADRTAAR